jgi:hypothetical protein
MLEIYEAVGPQYLLALQRRIDDGSIWHFEGSSGRAAADAISAGFCVLGPHRVRDYWGSIIPSRDEVKQGTKGSIEYATELHGETWVKLLLGEVSLGEVPEEFLPAFAD